MIKLVYCIARRQGLDREEFLRTWLHEHGPLVRRFAAAIGAVRYVQSHPMDSPFNAALAASRAMPEAYDGITEVWFETMADFEAALSTPEGMAAGAALLEDERRFIDFGRSRMFLTEEHEVIA
jgi:uncharacterized protein (TIGR02118 family)